MAVASFAEAPCTTWENADLFQSMIEHAGSIKAAACKSVCGPCPMKAECLPLGTFNGEVLPGVYGGLTQTERERL